VGFFGSNHAPWCFTFLHRSSYPKKTWFLLLLNSCSFGFRFLIEIRAPWGLSRLKKKPCSVVGRSSHDLARGVANDMARVHKLNGMHVPDRTMQSSFYFPHARAASSSPTAASSRWRSWRHPKRNAVHGRQMKCELVSSEEKAEHSVFFTQKQSSATYTHGCSIKC
jgi:hypothetical protein